MSAGGEPAPEPAHAAPPPQLPREPARLLVPVDLRGAVRPEPPGRGDRERPPAGGPVRRSVLLPGPPRLSGDDLRRRVPHRGGLSRPGRHRDDPREGVAPLAPDPVPLRHHQLRPAGARAGAAVASQLARDRRPGARPDGPADLRLPDLRPVRAHPDRAQLRDRGRRGRGPGLLRRADGPLAPALHRDRGPACRCSTSSSSSPASSSRRSGGSWGSCYSSAGCRSSAWSAPSSCAPATSTTCAPRARSASGTA